MALPISVKKKKRPVSRAERKEFWKRKEQEGVGHHKKVSGSWSS